MKLKQQEILAQVYADMVDGLEKELQEATEKPLEAVSIEDYLGVVQDDTPEHSLFKRMYPFLTGEYHIHDLSLILNVSRKRIESVYHQHRAIIEKIFI